MVARLCDRGDLLPHSGKEVEKKNYRIGLRQDIASNDTPSISNTAILS
jgi:hypothetical protein